MTKVLIDMNASEFQQSLFALKKIEQRALLNTLNKISKMTWGVLQVDRGIKWESIRGKATIDGYPIYSFRFSQKCRGTAYRKNDVFVLLDLFPDHDGAYE